MGKIIGALQALLFAGDDEKHDGAARRLRQAGEGAGQLEHAGDSARVVGGAVVDAIAIHRLADAEVVEMRGVENVLIAQRRIGAGEDGNQIWAVNRDVMADGVRGDGHRQGE